MERKHATVIALTFVLVGLMFFSVDTPLILQQEVEPVVHEVPEIVEQIAAEPVPQEPLRLNVVENGDFEEWDSGLHRPEVWYAQASAYQKSDDAYTDIVATGSYAGLAESQGNDIAYGSSYLYSNLGFTTTTLIQPGISLSFNWNTLTNPDIQIGAESFFYLQTDNGVGTSYNIYYYLSTDATGMTNSSNYGRILINETVNQWNVFDRNITEDFIAVFGSGPLTSESYVRGLWFYANSPTEATSKIQAVFDDVVLYNSTYSDWVENGDFESGTGNGWQTYTADAGYVTQSTDSVSGTYSMNASIPTMNSGSAFARCYQTFPTNFGYPVLYPRMNVIELDWKYNDAVGAGLSQYAYLRLNFYNGDTHYVHFYFGYGDDILHGTNTTTNYYIKMPGFGVRDAWQHSEIDLYEVSIAAGLYNMSIVEVSIYAYQGVVDAGVEILVDDFRMMTYPTSDPTFEYIDNWGQYSPFIGWGRFGGSGEVTQSTVAHGGTYSANITVENGNDGINRNLLYATMDPALSTDFWWRLEDIQATGLAYAWINLEFILSGANRVIRYVLGSSLSYPLTNTSTHMYILVDGYNQTGTWTHLSRNITADIENAFSISASDCYLFYFGVELFAAVGLRTSLLVDDLHFKDMVLPSIDSVSFDATPMYYEDVLVRVSAADVRPGVSSVFVGYSNDSWSSADFVPGIYDEGDWYNATIPAQVYNTHVDFYIQVTDGCGNERIDDNGYSFYSYTVGDDVIPSVSFTSPSFFEEVEGQVSIVIDAVDLGSGVAFVELYIDSGVSMPLVMNDTVAPYEYSWNTDVESLGDYTLYTNVVDNVGLSNGAIVNVTVVDTIAPVLDSPADIEFIVGETGHTMDWNPIDLRPYGYVVYVDDVITYFGSWNSSSEHIVIELDGLAVGTYNFTCVVVDGSINGAIDTVIVTVNAEATTTTTTSSSTTTSSTGAGGGDFMTPLLIIAVVGFVGIILVVFVVLPKLKKT